MLISYWSSDLCASDLEGGALVERRLDVVDEDAGRDHPVPALVLGGEIELHRIVDLGARPASERLGVALQIGVRLFGIEEGLVVIARYRILLLQHVLADLLLEFGRASCGERVGK